MNDSKLASRLNNVNNPFTKKFNKPVVAATTESTTNTDNTAEETIRKPIGTLTLKKKLPDPVAENHVENPFVVRKPLTLKPLHKTEENKAPETITETADVATVTTESVESDIVTDNTENEITVSDAVEKPVENDNESVENSSEVVEDIDTEPDEATTDETETKVADDAPAPIKKKRIRRTKQQIEADNAALAAAKTTTETTTDTIDSADTDADNEIESVNSKATGSNVESTASVSIDNVAITGNSTVGFNEAAKVFDSFGDEDEWIKFYEDVIKVNADIKITTDINTSSLIGAVCQLSNLRDRIWQPMNYYKNELDSISSKEPEGFLERAKRMTVDPNATNDALRKKAATYACMNYKLKSGDIINLYDYLDKVRERYNFLRSVMDNIEFKKSCLMLAASALKVESSLTA